VTQNYLVKRKVKFEEKKMKEHDPNPEKQNWPEPFSSIRIRVCVPLLARRMVPNAILPAPPVVSDGWGLAILAAIRSHR